MNSMVEASETLRRWALDEHLKSVVMQDPELAPMARRAAQRYIAGEQISDALETARHAASRGHRVSLEYAGESVRNQSVAGAETEVFVELSETLARTGTAATVSADLSHLGLLVDPQLAVQNARRIITALPSGTTFMISAEGSDRTEAVLEVYEKLARSGLDVGITLQARLHRSLADLDRLLLLPGRIRLVKGAFLEPETVALRREDPQLPQRYLRMASAIGATDRPLTLATHDEQLLRQALQLVGTTARELEIEMLMGLGPQLLDNLRLEGFTTREDAIFGDHWWLYVLNRMAEKPERIYDLIVDLGRTAS